MRTPEKVQKFADRLYQEYNARLAADCPNVEPYKVRVREGRRWVKVDLDQSGKYMVDRDGSIYGVKAYGVPHLGHQYGTLDTIEKWDWSDYTAVQKR